MDAKTKRDARLRRHTRVRKKVAGSADAPAPGGVPSNRHIYAQLIDDVQAVTLAAASDAEVKGDGKTARAKAVGELIASRAKEAGIERRGVRPRRPALPRPRGSPRRGRPRGRTPDLT